MYSGLHRNLLLSLAEKSCRGIRILARTSECAAGPDAPGGSFVFPAVNIWGIWAVVIFHLLAFALCMDGVHSIWKYSRKGKGGVSGKRFEWLWASGLMPTAAVAVLLLYGWWNMHHIVRTSYTVYTDKLIRKEGYRIAFFF